MQKAFLSKMKNEHVIMNQALYGQFLQELLRKKTYSVTKTCKKNQREICLDCPLEELCVCLSKE